VICLFFLPCASTADLGLFLERRQLNVAISHGQASVRINLLKGVFGTKVKMGPFR
jgi:hypothetical protein